MATSAGFADAVLRRLPPAYDSAADPQRAAAMAAYLRWHFAFLGIPAPRRRELSREVLDGLPAPTESDLRAVADACWGMRCREYQYFAVDLLVRHATKLTDRSLADLERLITTRSWWDTVDALASRVVGSLVTRHPELVAVMDSWVDAHNIWLVRAALLHQLRYREATDADRLFGYCRRAAGHREFFVRKAIGWALREYARYDPEAVQRFVTAARLPALATREALRNLT